MQVLTSYSGSGLTDAQRIDFSQRSTVDERPVRLRATHWLSIGKRPNIHSEEVAVPAGPTGETSLSPGL
eukprot:13854256-Alexandrium_andersonii.AAC.1